MRYIVSATLFSDDPEHSKDLPQEVFLNIWKSLDGFKGGAHVNTRVYRITLNICLRDKSSVKKRSQRFVPMESLVFKDFPAGDDSGEDLGFTDLHACIKTLKTDSALP